MLGRTSVLFKVSSVKKMSVNAIMERQICDMAELIMIMLIFSPIVIFKYARKHSSTRKLHIHPAMPRRANSVGICTIISIYLSSLCESPLAFIVLS